MRLTKLNHRLVIKIEILILTILFGSIFFQNYKSNPAIREAIVMATTVKPESFTELYFENHTQLSDKITRWQQYSLSFTIHNLEYQEMDYPYVVYLQRDTEKIILSQGSVTLKHDESKTINDTVGPFKNLRTKIVVKLTNKNQTISYWLDEVDKTSPSPAVAKPTLIILKKYTQLYFNGRLPFIVTPQDKTINFTFTVRNLKNKDIIYPYEIYLEDNGQKTQINKGQFSLNKNELKTISESYTLINPISSAKIFVHLPTENDYIYFKLKGIQ